jgi:hypothetical protein
MMVDTLGGICISKDKNVMARKYYLKNHYLTLWSKVKVPPRLLRYTTHRLMVMHPHTKYHWPISRQKCYGPDKKILFKKQLFDREVKGQGPTKVITVCDTPPYGHAPTYQISLTYLERQKCYGSEKKILFKKQLYDLEVKVPQRSLRYATHRLTVMHPHTKYHWPISKDKNVMARTRKYYLKNNYLTLRSKSHEGHYGTRHTALWSCTHTKNNWPIWKDKKKLWLRQASLRRSRSVRGKNQTKTICLPSFEGET